MRTNFGLECIPHYIMNQIEQIYITFIKSCKITVPVEYTVHTYITKKNTFIIIML